MSVKRRSVGTGKSNDATLPARTDSGADYPTRAICRPLCRRRAPQIAVGDDEDIALADGPALM